MSTPARPVRQTKSTAAIEEIGKQAEALGEPSEASVDDFADTNRPRRQRLDKVEALGATRTGGADALLVDTAAGTSLLTLVGADWTSRRLVQTMSEGAMVTTLDAIVLTVNPRMTELLRTTSDRIHGHSALPLLAASSRTAFRDLIAADHSTGGPVELTFRTAEGTPVPTRVTVSRLELGDQVAVCVLVTDMSAQNAAGDKLAASERWFHTLVQNNSDLIEVLDATGRIVYANPATLSILGFSPSEHVGCNVLSFIHPDDLERARTAFARDLAAPGPHPPSIYRFRTKSGDWRLLEVFATNCVEDPAIAGVVINARDVTDRMNLTQALRTLSTGSQILVHATDELSLLTDTCRNIVESGGYPLAWVGYAEHDEARSVREVASAGQTAHSSRLGLSWADDESGQGPAGKAIRSGVVQVVKDMRQPRRFAPWRESAEKNGLRCFCVLPLVLDGDNMGVLTIYGDEEGDFAPSALALLGELAGELAYGIGRIRDAGALRTSESRFRTLADAAPIGILELAPGGVVTYVNSGLARICGRRVGALMGRSWIDAIHQDDVSRLLELLDEVPSGPSGIAASFRIERPDGEVRHVRMSAAPKDKSLDSGLAMTMADVTEEVQAQRELAHQAFYDPLTGLPNRALFLDRLGKELAQCRRNGLSVAVLVLDLDRFRVVNDSLGHEAGDVVLKEVGERFVNVARAGETVAHFSGDEFTFMIRDVHDIEDASSAARRLLNAVESPIPCAGRDLRLTGSIGIAVSGADGDAAAILSDADTAMFQAKAAGRNRYALFDEELHRRSKARFSMEGELRDALARDEFELYFQPVVDPANGRPKGAEALIRWHHPTRGMVAPLEFVPVAEESGLIKPIGDWVFERALYQLALWDAEDGAPRLETLAVNLSAPQLDDDNTADMISEALDRCGIAANRVWVEITESVIMGDSAFTRKSLQRFKDLGLHVAIDDFGTGYSSLAYLHTLPVTTVKVDGSFVSRLDGDDDSTPVVRAIVEMSHALGLSVVAEGVSDERLQKLVSAMGCDEAQGYYWSPPLPPGEFVRWWREAAGRVSWPASRPTGPATRPKAAPGSSD